VNGGGGLVSPARTSIQHRQQHRVHHHTRPGSRQRAPDPHARVRGDDGNGAVRSHSKWIVTAGPPVT